MFRRLRTFLISLTLVLVATIGTAFSIFYFGDLNFYINDLDQELRVDNVKENYSFGRDEELDTEYTIYLFPSSLYAVIYDDYLNKIYDNDLNNNETATKPEEAFGYIEASLENGEVSYTPYTEGKKGHNGYKNYYQYISSGEIENSNHYLLDSEIKGNSSSSYVTNSGAELNDSGLGDPSIILNDKYSNEHLSNENKNLYLNRNQFRYDRFGAWENLEAVERGEDGEYIVNSNDVGRYLPQKLVVRQSVTADNFSTYTMEPITSLGDSHGWHNFAFSSWTTFKIENNKIVRPYIGESSGEDQFDFSLWPFLSGDILSYFNIMNNLSEYADQNNVIRLFPYFSNGKNYGKSINGVTNGPSEPQYGGRDAIKIQYSLANETNMTRERYFMYNNNSLNSSNSQYNDNEYDGLVGENSWFYNYKYDLNHVHYALLSNIKLEKNMYSSFKIMTHMSDGENADWGEHDSAWSTKFFSDDDLNELNGIIDTYGEGLYNIYIFVGNSGSLSRDSVDIGGIGQDVSENLVTGWPEFYQKKLISLGSNVMSFRNFITYYRNLSLYIEKVSEGRLYKDLNSTYSSEGELQQVINNSYNQADNFVMYTYPIHSTTSNNNELIVGNNIVENNPYVYLLRNVNFTDVENLSFQIRFSQSYIKDTKFNLGGSGGGNPVILNPTNSNGTYSYNENQVFIPASNYFNVSAISFNDGVGNSQECFTLGNATNKGVYDILLIYRATVGNVDEFEMYAYRHTINFIKLYRVGTNIKVDDNTGLAIHTKEDGSALDEQIWMGRANIGENLDPSNFMSSETNSSGQLISLQDALENYLGNDSNTYSNYIVRDYVTDQIVMYYHNGAWQTDNFVILKNYLFIVEKVN